MKTILLIVPREGDYIHREALIPPGMAYINGALRHAGLPVVSCNLNFAEGQIQDILRGLILENDAGYILCGGTTFNHEDIRRCFAAAKEICPGIVCIGGGAGYTSEPDLFLKMTGADVAVLGEGEITTVELMQTLGRGGDLSQVRGILFRAEAGNVRTPDRPVVPDLDDIPFPSYEGLGIEQYFENEKNYDTSALFDYSYTDQPRVLPMFLGRSCPFGCKFCFHTLGRQYRNRSLDNFFAELDMWIGKYDINGILLMDELFGGKKETILAFCRRIKPYNIPWVAEIRVELASYEVLKAMRDSGCTHLQFGLESMCEYVLEDMNKRIRPGQIEQALRDSYELKLHVFGNFIFGAEAEDMNSFLVTYNWWNRHRKYQIRLLNIMAYPGSAYFKNSVERGIIKDKERFIREGMPEINMSRMSEYEWDKMRRVIRMTYIDNVFFGRIVAVHEKENDLTLDVRCCHCREIYPVEHVKKEKRFSRNNMVSVCPCCGRNNGYNFDSFSGIMGHEVMSQWIRNRAEGVSCGQWLKARGYKKIILWGASEQAELLAKELKGLVEFAAVAVRDIYRLSSYSYLGRTMPILSVEELCAQQADAVVVTEVSEYTANAEYLRENGCELRIDSLVNFVFGMEYHLVIPEGKNCREIMEPED